MASELKTMCSSVSFVSWKSPLLDVSLLFPPVLLLRQTFGGKILSAFQAWSFSYLCFLLEDALCILDQMQTNLRMMFVQGELMNWLKEPLCFMFYLSSILKPKMRQNDWKCHLTLSFCFSTSRHVALWTPFILNGNSKDESRLNRKEFSDRTASFQTLAVVFPPSITIFHYFFTAVRADAAATCNVIL